MSAESVSGEGQSIWLRPERSGRGPVPEHSRAEIAAAGVALADSGGLRVVTIRSVAAAIAAAPASLYRYVATRDEIVELMADRVYGEYRYDREPPRDPAAALLALSRQGLDLYRRHPWLLEVRTAGTLPGPNAIAFIDHALAALAGTSLAGPARLETIGLVSGAVRMFAQAEADQRSAGQDLARWQQSLAGYLLRITAGGGHPHLAEALSGQQAGGDNGPEQPVFDRAMSRILAGLLPGAGRPA